MRLYKNIMFLSAMFLANVWSGVTLKDIYNLEIQILSAAKDVNNFQRKSQRIAGVFLKNDGIFNNLGTVTSPDQEFFVFGIDENNENQIIKGTQAFPLHDPETDKLLDIMRLAARGEINDRAKPVAMRKDSKICVIDIDFTELKDPNVDSYYFSVNVFDEIPISEDFKNRVPKFKESVNDPTKKSKIKEFIKTIPVIQESNIPVIQESNKNSPTEIIQKNFEDDFKIKLSNRDLIFSCDPEELFKLISGQIANPAEVCSYSIVEKSDQTKELIRATFVLNGDKLHVVCGAIKNYPDYGFHFDLNPEVKALRGKFDKLTKEIQDLKPQIDNRGRSVAQSQAMIKQRADKLNEAFELYNKIRDAEAFKSIAELTNPTSPPPQT